MEDVFQFVEGTECCIGFADANGRLVDLLGDGDFLHELEHIHWTVGSCWNEEHAGTNGLALALIESFPAQVCGAEHYCAVLAEYCTTAAPVYDSLGGLVGALVLVTRAAASHLHTVSMINATANALSAELRMHLWIGNANELLFELNAILQTLSEGIILLDSEGAIRQMNARAGRLLSIAPARVAGHKLGDVVDMPRQLTATLRAGRELYDEEMTFRSNGAAISCVCTLHVITAPASLGTLPLFASAVSPAIAPSKRSRLSTGLNVSPHVAVGGFVLTLRSIERVQRLVHRMAGAQAHMRFSDIIGESSDLLAAVRLAQIASESTSTVLLHGETGTGKEVFAQSIHNASDRAHGPFVAINCAAIPRELISSELFGYEGGAFTGADRQGRPGKFEMASGGTLFLDEIGDMPRDLQTSLLRAIETRSIVRVGGQTVLPVDVRIIAATHQDLARESETGSFRPDLFFRLNVFPIEMPPLRERPGDVPLLVGALLQRLSTRLGRSLGVEGEALAALEKYAWPGNVRELENVVERVVYVSERGIISLRDLPENIRAIAHLAAQPGSPPSQFGAIGAAPRAGDLDHERPDHMSGLQRESAGAEAALIRRALQRCDGNVTRAAQVLGISRTTLWRKKQRYRL